MGDPHHPEDRVADGIRRWAHTGRLRPGSRLPAERALAEAFGVGRASVRAALARLEREGAVRATSPRIRVLERADGEAGLGEAVLVLCPRDFRPSAGATGGAAMSQQLFAGIASALDAAGRDLVLVATDRAAERLPRLLAARPRGAIVVEDVLGEAALGGLLERLAHAGVPTALAGDWFDPANPAVARCASVESDHRAGSRALTELLIARGRRRILRLWGFNQLGERPPAWIRGRDHGYEEACAAARVAPLPAIVVPRLLHDAFGARADAEQIRHTVGCLVEAQRTRFDAVMVTSDGAVPDTMAALRLVGRTPGEDVDVVGYDAYWPRLAHGDRTPPLATVDRRLGEIGERLVAGLAAVAELPQQPPREVIPPRLVHPVAGHQRP